MFKLQDIKSLLATKLKSDSGILHTGLPGDDAHEIMSVPGRGKYPTVPATAKKAAVLLLLYEKIDRVFITLIERGIHEKDRHSGQISFPGGKMEEQDDFPVQTALREAQEEIGISNDVEVLGTMSPLYIPVSGFHVFPVVAIANKNISFTIQQEEVKNLLEVDLSFIVKEYTKSTTTIPMTGSLVLREVPCYKIHDHIIWGATAMILSELEWILKGK